MRKIKFFGLIVFLVVLLAGCMPIAANLTLSFDVDAINLAEGETFVLLPKVIGTSEFQVLYDGYDEGVISVSANGEILALAEGLTIIKANLVGQNISANIVVSVSASSDETGEYSIVAVGDLNDLKIDGSIQLSLKRNGVNYPGSVIWISAKPAIAEVDSSSGLVKAKSSGTVIITAVLGDKTASVNITVKGANDEQVGECELCAVGGLKNLEINETIQLELKTKGQSSVTATGEFTWLSSRTNIATVNEDGLVTALSSGVTSITVVYGLRMATIDITVNETNDEIEEITSLLIIGENMIFVGATENLAVSPNIDLVFEVTWSSSNTDAATVDSNGVVTAVASGLTEITATLVSDNSITASFVMFVREVVSEETNITAISVDGTNEVLTGNKIKLTHTFTPSNETGQVLYTSSNPSVASVDQNGWVLGVGGGVVTVTVKLTQKPSIITSMEVTVIPLPNTIAISGVSNLYVGANATLQASILPSGANQTVVWESNNNAIATVSENGVVLAIAAGSVTLTASSKGNAAIKATHTITIINIPTISLSKTVDTINIGETTTLTATVNNLSNTSVTWVSSNANIATVSTSGVVKAIAPGSATITASSVADTALKATCNITVRTPTIALSKTSAAIVAGGTVSLTATVINLSNTAVTWTSSNTAIATVSTGGVVSSKAAGSATITATSVAYASLKATCTITVTAAPSAKTITLAIGKSALVVDEQTQITPTIKGTTNFAVIYSTSNTAIALVTSSGVVTAKGSGSVVITVKLIEDSSVQATVTITVTPNTFPAPGTKTGVLDLKLLIGSSPSIILGESIELTITGATSRYNYTWTSSNATVAPVSDIGKISGAKVGYATITATLKTDTSKKGTYSIRVYEDYTSDISIVYSGGAVLSVGNTTQLSISSSTGDTSVNWFSNNTAVATISSTGLVTALSAGTALITANLKSKPTVQATAYIIVGSGNVVAHKAVFTWLEQYLVSTTFSRKVATYGNRSLQESVLGSVSYFWPGPNTINKDFYGRTHVDIVGGIQSVTIHHTGNNDLSAGARNTASFMSGSPDVSIHYATDGNSVYAVNKETSTAWHAGDGSSTFGLTNSGIAKTTQTPQLGISTDGYWTFNGTKSSIKAPTNDGVILKTANILPSGIYTEVGTNGNYYIGNTYYQSGYGAHICNGGGNRNSIGIEMCQNENNDLFMTWHRTAKLTADILKRHSLNTSRVRQHFNQSGKNCPQELREAGLWTDVFAKMIKAEYQYTKLYSDYTISFSSSNAAIMNNYGHIVSKPSVDTQVAYTVVISKGGVTESKTYSVTVPCNVGVAITGRADWSEIR